MSIDSDHRYHFYMPVSLDDVRSYAGYEESATRMVTEAKYYEYSPVWEQVFQAFPLGEHSESAIAEHTYEFSDALSSVRGQVDLSDDNVAQSVLDHIGENGITEDASKLEVINAALREGGFLRSG